MDEFTQPPAIVSVSNDERASQLIREARALDGVLKVGIRTSADQMVERGKLLVKAQQLAPKGKFDAKLATEWPDISRRTAYRYMKLVTDQARSAMVALVESHTHKVLTDKDGEEDSEEGKPTPLTVNERKILIFLIGTVNPALAKKLRDGTKKMTDAELKAATPPSCSRCARGAMIHRPGQPCAGCEKLRRGEQANLFEESEEPEDEGDSGSPPKPPPDPYIAVKKEVTKAASMLTKIAGEDRTLYDAFVACRLMDHPHGEAPKFKALAGVGKIIAMIEDGETDLKKIKAAYDIASGGFIPPMHERKK